MTRRQEALLQTLAQDLQLVAYLAYCRQMRTPVTAPPAPVRPLICPVCGRHVSDCYCLVTPDGVVKDRN